MKQALTYSLKVWFTSLSISPILYVLIELTVQPHIFRDWSSVLGFYAYCVAYGAVLSIPCWLVSFGLTAIINDRQVKENVAKLILSLLGGIIAPALFYIVFGHDDDFKSIGNMIWVLSYCIVIIVSVWIYKLVVKPLVTYED